MSYQHIYLSPHYDDAALSCGGSIHRQTKAGEPVLVITVCAAPPPAQTAFSLFAREMHTQWGDPTDVIAQRQAEDQTAMEILGADTLRLDVTDCIYRGAPPSGIWFYNNNDELFGEIHPGDKQLEEQLVASLAHHLTAQKNTVVYAPLAIGYHVDHQLVHAAAWQLYQQGQPVLFYEDYPYVDTTAYGNANLDKILAQLDTRQQPVQPRLQFFSEANLENKINSIGAYTSQITMLFGNQAAATESVRRYALQVGGGQPAERVWVPV
jgi:LmbE family N-acetylglucosaminyl deacetylase